MRRTVVSIACTVTLFAAATPASATPPDARQAAMDAAVAAGIPGMIAVAGDWRGSSGVAETGREGKPDPAGSFRVASVSKPFVATLVLQLVGEGRVELDGPVQRYLPGLLPYPEPITVRQLLQHTSGLPRDLAPADTWAKLADFDTQRFTHFGEAEAVRSSTSQPLLFPPGTRWSYSNTGYNVLAMLVEKVTHQRLDRVLAERITGPLRLRDTFLPGDFPFVPHPAAHGYEQLYPSPSGLTDVTIYNYTRYFGAGEVISSGKDLNTFFHALFSGKLLPAEQLKQMKTAVPTGSNFGYGLGLMELPLAPICGGAGPVIWGHAGDLPGFNTFSFEDGAGTRQITTLATVDLTASPEAMVKRQVPFITEFCTPRLPATANAQVMPSGL